MRVWAIGPVRCSPKVDKKKVEPRIESGEIETNYFAKKKKNRNK